MCPLLHVRYYSLQLLGFIRVHEYFASLRIYSRQLLDFIRVHEYFASLRILLFIIFYRTCLFRPAKKTRFSEDGCGQ